MLCKYFKSSTNWFDKTTLRGAEIEANLNGWLFCFYESVIEFRYAINPFELVVVLKQQSNNILFTFDL